jgi:hypothetical protein
VLEQREEGLSDYTEEEGEYSEEPDDNDLLKLHDYDDEVWGMEPYGMGHQA